MQDFRARELDQQQDVELKWFLVWVGLWIVALIALLPSLA